MKLEPLIYVSDLKRSVDFYTETLGFALGELFPNQEKPTYAPVFIGDCKLMLVLVRESNKKSVFCSSWQRR
jgi:catechol 2,3-dioxygenase-like lactoylglutathione lyase family enzyme